MHGWGGVGKGVFGCLLVCVFFVGFSVFYPTSH